MEAQYFQAKAREVFARAGGDPDKADTLAAWAQGLREAEDEAETVALLERNPDPDEAAIRRELSANLCRCGTHVEIIRAVQRAAVLMREERA